MDARLDRHPMIGPLVYRPMHAGESTPLSATPARPRRAIFGITLQTGLQGKLVLCYIFLLVSALGASCWLFVSEGRATLDRMASQNARQLARTLAMASEPPLVRGDAAELQRIGAELMKNRGLLGVAFFDASGKQLAVAAQDPDHERPGAHFFTNPREHGALLDESQPAWTPSLGPYVQVAVPVMRLARTERAGASGEVVGFVTVCLSQAETDARVGGVAFATVLIGAVAVLVCWPAMYGVVHRVFAPIRQLVSAADRLAAGDLSARVDIDRPDVIGTLARSFNEMVKKVRASQEDLATANLRLADANVRLEEANEELESANHDLERKVAERTAELERTNKRLSAEMADKDDFLRTVSHDLNAPLRNIAGMATVLLMKHRESFDPDVVHRLERIQKNVEVETDLISELLELSRIKSRRQKMEPVDFGELVRDVGEMFGQDFDSRGIKFCIDTPLPTLHCERARMRQLFQNLIDNAIKYMGPGSASSALASAGLSAGDPDAAGLVRAIHIGCHESGKSLELYVRDTGMGIEEADQENVFRVFRRGRSQAVQSVAGKGVGLASVKSIIETYGGTIRVESKVGLGSTFRFTIDSKYLTAAHAERAAA